MLAKNFVLLITLVLSFIVTMDSVRKMRRFALQKQIVDHPGGRKGHSNQVPLLGGIAIWFGFSISIIFALGLVSLLWRSTSLLKFLPNLHLWGQEISIELPAILAVIIAASGITVLGLMDDLIKNGLHYRTKFIVQFLVAAIVVVNGVSIHIFPWPWLNLLVSLFWIVGIMNAINLLDGMDGLAAGVSAISATGFLLLSLSNESFYTAILLISLIGCCLGFLRYNFYPARIFMGDAGSLLLGFLLSTMAIICLNSVQPGITNPIVLFPIMVLSIPIYDTFSVILIRIRKRRHPFIGDKNHFFHRLVRLGMSRKNTVFLIYVLNVIAVTAAFLLNYLSWWWGGLIVAITIGFYALLPKFVSLYRTKILPITSTPPNILKSKNAIYLSKDRQIKIEPQFEKSYFQNKKKVISASEHSDH